MKTAIPFGCIAVGLLLLLGSSLWATLFPPTSRWTEEKALRAAEVKARLSNLGPIVNSARNIHRGPDPASVKAEFDALVLEDQQLNAEFVAAANRPKTASSLLKWSGISLAAIGIIGWYAVKQSS